MLRKLLLLNLYLYITLSCPDQDQRCNSCYGKQCRLCENSFLDIAGICQVPENQIDYCLRYKTRHACQECQYGYQTDEFGQCKSIQIKNCVELKNQNECLICDQNRLTQNGTCETDKTCSIKNCQYCYVDPGRKIERCQRCFKEYVILIQNEVEVCVPETQSLKNCHFADVEDQKKCRICDLNFYYANGRCLQNSICNFLILALEDKSLSNIQNFEPQVHLAKWLRIISPFNFTKKIVQNLTWEKATELVDSFVIQYGVKETLNLDYISLKIKEEQVLFSALIQILIIHSAFNDVHYESIIEKMEVQKRQCLLQHLKQFTDEFKQQIQYYFQQEKQTFKDRNEILKILVETEKKLAESEEKNKLLKASLEDRQKMKKQFETKLDLQRKSTLELQDLKNYNQEQIEQQNLTIHQQDIKIQQLQSIINKLKRENSDIEDTQNKIYSDMSDMKDKIDIYESQIKQNRKKLIENNELHFQLRQSEQKLNNYKELQEVSHDQKYQIQMLQNKSQELQKQLETLQQTLQKKEQVIGFFQELQKEFEKKNSVSLSKIIALEKDNTRFKAFNKSLMQKIYLDDKKQFNIKECDQKIFRKSWIQDEKVQETLLENYRNELTLRDQKIEDLEKIIKEQQQ